MKEQLKKHRIPILFLFPIILVFLFNSSIKEGVYTCRFLFFPIYKSSAITEEIKVSTTIKLAIANFIIYSFWYYVILLKTIVGHKAKDTKLVLQTIWFIFISEVLLFITAVVKFFKGMYSGNPIEELLFHMKADMTSANFASFRALLKNFYLYNRCLWFIFLLTLALLVLLKKDSKNNVRKLQSISLLAVIILLMTTLFSAYKQYGLNEIIVSKTVKSSFKEENYVSDAKITSPEKKKNLIYIYVESLEVADTDKAIGGTKDQNFIPQLTKLSQLGENFSSDSKKLNGALVTAGAGWTTGGMVAQTSGTPIITDFKDILKDNKAEMKDVTAVGNILENDGYNNYLMKGANARFGNVDVYYTSHGNYKYYDLHELITNGDFPPEDIQFWGIPDSSILSLAKKYITEASQSGEPFNFTIETQNTHFPDGNVEDESNINEDLEYYDNALLEDDELIASFIRWVQAQDFYEDTVIIIAGDHLNMNSSYYTLEDDYQRKTYLSILNSDTKKELNTYREYSTLDLAPTTLAALGYTIEGNQLGYGVNLYSSKETLVEKYGLSTLNFKLSNIIKED